MSERESAQIFRQKFAKNFSIAFDTALPVLSQSSVSAPQLVFNCTETAVMEALTSCPNSYSSPDGISFKLLKLIAQFIFRPLNIVFQHSLLQGIFPHIWKHAIISPLYRGYGDPSIPASYRPISLCTCLGKLLEKIVYKLRANQLFTYQLCTTRDPTWVYIWKIHPL